MTWLVLLGLLLVVAISLSIRGFHHKKVALHTGKFLSRVLQRRRVASYRGRLLGQVNRVRRRNGFAPLKCKMCSQGNNSLFY
jgi:hypothetical protein